MGPGEKERAEEGEEDGLTNEGLGEAEKGGEEEGGGRHLIKVIVVGRRKSKSHWAAGWGR